MELKYLPYDKTNPKSIEKYAKKLKGKTFYDILKNNISEDCFNEVGERYNQKGNKGSLGSLLEEYYFFYMPNSEAEPDFKEAGVELKVTPYEITKKNKIRAGERLVIGMIPNNEPIETNFYKSHLFYKMNLILFIFYLRDKSLKKLNYPIDYIKLVSFLSDACKEDLKIIIEDYKLITSKIIDGRAHELSEGDTKYLGACTKGSTAIKSLQPQYYNSKVLAKRRAFSLKQGYMTYILNKYILNNLDTYEAALTADELDNVNFDEEIIRRIEKFNGKTEEELCDIFNINISTKQRNNIAVCRMIGVKTDRVAEFEKADIKIKTIRVKKNGKPRESMSFPNIKIKDFVNETFEESKLYDYFSKTRFLFVIFKEQSNGKYILIGSKFWNMPIVELDTIGKQEWELYQKKFINGVNFKIKKQKNGIVIQNDLPGQKNTKIFHLRPHAQKSCHLINGVKYGNGNNSDMDELPNGDKMTKQCFWLNNYYVENIIKEKIKGFDKNL